ncbi:hypothetical protein [Lysobacter sp. CFH 32150]|uniref:hypothetical protein n=1 Tax=Lysobacter sp. CFH 32150 TaxID=2927128 RepID=UPI001FA7D00E|nr:hypothetical protein [Lysobacter sp. CFH 32150]MCI4568052.1 hypothetical protein [Lysobacter sp. CFH 32150]
MSNTKKGQSIVADVIAPVGTVIGAFATTAAKITVEASDPADNYIEHFHSSYHNAAYYKGGRDWNDYAPAYRFGYDSYRHYRGQDFEDVEHALARDWNSVRAGSRLAWDEARGAVRDSWHYLESNLTGDFDHDRG